mmetsp:Transcript_22835/g.52263  ORF Transcript_22835/g.52263 Transcript_22835/m.52263 type:complete len:877 (-) Transcript_22835:83-2713(-)
MATASLCSQVRRLHDEGRTEEAAEALRSVASRASPQDACRLYRALAELEQARGRNSDACRAWEAVVRIDPASTAGWRGLVASASESGNEEAELLALRALSEIEKDKPDWLVCLGRLLAKRGATEEAKVHLQHALQISPKSISALLALARLSTGDEAIWLYEKASLAEPTAAEALEGAAAARWGKGDFKVAGQWYRAVLNKRPDHPVALCRMAELLLQENNSQESLMLLTRATRQEPNLPEAVLWLAYVHLLSGQVHAAIAPLQAMVRSTAGMPSKSLLLSQACLVLSLSLAEEGDVTQAEEYFCNGARHLPSVQRWREERSALDKDVPIDRLGTIFTKELPGASAKMLRHLEVLLQQYRSKFLKDDPKKPAAEANDWREDLKEGKSVEVYSKSGQRWIPSTVLQLSREMVKVKYLIHGHWCEKVLLRDSEFLRMHEASRSSQSSSLVTAEQAGGQKPQDLKDAALSARGVPGSSGGNMSLAGTASTGLNSSGTQSSTLLGLGGSRTPRGFSSPSQAGQRKASIPRTRAANLPGDLKANPPSSRASSPHPSSPSKVQSERRSSSKSSIKTEREEQPATHRRRSEASGSTPPSSQPLSDRTKSTPQRLPEFLDSSSLQFGVVLGNGGFGSVYRGTYFGEEVAIKKMHLMDGKITDAQVEEFKKEVRNLQALRHPRLVRFIGAAYMAPTLCIVTDYMPNGSLYALLHKRKEVISFAKQQGIALQLCEGVDFLHGHEPPFVHRDLKSLNIVLDFELNAKLCDFGLTQTMEKTHITRREQEGGSPRYMAPELFDSKGKITEKVDIWALGCLILEVFSGHMPHEECSSVQQVMMKLLVQGDPPFAMWDTVPEKLHCLASLCFTLNARQRADATQLLQVVAAL